MYPNPQDVLPLPPRPDLHQYRKRAKDLVKACRSGSDTAIEEWASRWVRDLPDASSSAERHAEQVAGFARERLGADCALAAAQFVIARAHGFESWPKLVHHLEALAGTHTPVSVFEEAADAIIAGDRAALERLLREQPDLIQARSTREHRATLLHYVAANGVENYRQKTPRNVVEIARVLLDAGADVHAEADVYGGGATTFGLTVTSAHPRLAGVQNALADLLLERGATIGPGTIHGCLMNGCPEVAGHLAGRGLALTLEEAAGIGRLDVIDERIAGGDVVADPDWQQEVGKALMMAVWYSRTEVVAFLLDRGFDPAWKVRGDGESRTALHLAAYQGRVAIVELLLARGAPVDVTDDVYGTTPLVWALHAWLAERRNDPDSYRVVVRMLAEAGATVKPAWIDDDRVRADAALYELLLRGT